MHDEVRKCAEANDIKGLKYIFVDCLDVDPTFEKYKDDYKYCEDNVKKLFEDHEELRPMSEDPNDWDMGYWAKLKTDLIKNFSKERFQHMRKVAEVIHKEKIIRLREERKQAAMKAESIPKQIPINRISSTQVQQNTALPSKKEEEERRAENARKREAKNLAVKKAEEEQKRSREERKQKMEKQSQMGKGGDPSPKKMMGVLLVLVGIFIIILAILIINQWR